MANRLAHEVLGRTLDELPPQTRRLLGLLDEMVTASAASAGDRPRRLSLQPPGACARRRAGATRSSRCTSSAWWSWSTCSCTAGGRGQSFVYELLYDGGGARAGEPFLTGLIDVDGARRMRYDGDVGRGSEHGGVWSAPGPGPVGRCGSADETLRSAEKSTPARILHARRPENARRDAGEQRIVVRSRIRPPARGDRGAARSARDEAAGERRDPTDPVRLPVLAARRYLEDWLRVENYCRAHASRTASSLQRFITWCDERGITAVRR